MVHNKRKGPRQACLSYDQESPDITSECKLCTALQLKCLITRTVNSIMWHDRSPRDVRVHTLNIN